MMSKPKNILKLGRFQLKESYETEEPVPCMGNGCNEMLNGLNHFWIDVGSGVQLDTWLCDECAKKFKRALRGDMMPDNSDKINLKERVDRITHLELEIRKIVEKYTPEKYPTYYEIDTLWGCGKSPFGWCCYNHFEDPAHDRCIYCHEPQERK